MITSKLHLYNSQNLAVLSSQPVEKKGKKPVEILALPPNPLILENSCSSIEFFPPFNQNFFFQCYSCPAPSRISLSTPAYHIKLLQCLAPKKYATKSLRGKDIISLLFCNKSQFFTSPCTLHVKKITLQRNRGGPYQLNTCNIGVEEETKEPLHFSQKKK